MVTFKRRMRASGSCPAEVCPGGAEVVRRMASHNFRGSHDQVQIEGYGHDSLGCANDQHIQASLEIRTFITKDLNAARHQARPHSCDAAHVSRRNGCRYHDGN